jgi:hypothetical protein
MYMKQHIRLPNKLVVDGRRSDKIYYTSEFLIFGWALRHKLSKGSVPVTQYDIHRCCFMINGRPGNSTITWKLP